jgi:hypothetical protein
MQTNCSRNKFKHSRTLTPPLPPTPVASPSKLPFRFGSATTPGPPGGPSWLLWSQPFPHSEGILGNTQRSVLQATSWLCFANLTTTPGPPGGPSWLHRSQPFPRSEGILGNTQRSELQATSWLCFMKPPELRLHHLHGTSYRSP